MDRIKILSRKAIHRFPMLARVSQVINLFFQRRMPRAAAAITYYLLLSLFPVLIIATAIIGRLKWNLSHLLSNITGLIPADVTETIFGFLNYVDENYSTGMLVCGISMLAIFGCGSFSTLFNTMGDLYGIRRYRKGISHFAMCLLYTGIMILSLLVMIVLLGTGQWMIHLINRWIPTGPFLENWNWLRFVFFAALIEMVLCAIFHFTAPKKSPRIPILPGALFGTVALVVVSMLFSFFISRSVQYTLVFGSLVSIVILALWIHLMAYIILIGGVINYVAYDMRMERMKKL